MKKLVLTAILTTLCVGVYAQGKINLVNDSTRLVYFQSTLAADSAYVGQATPTNTASALPSGKSLVVDLYGGTSSADMTLQQTTTMSPSLVGGFGPRNFSSLTLTTTGVYYTFQVQVRDSAFTTAALARDGFSYYGFSDIFTMKTGPSLQFFAINNANATFGGSSWAAGSVALGGGRMGAIPLNIVPEPSTFALAGLGAAAMLIFRRRK